MSNSNETGNHSEKPGKKGVPDAMKIQVNGIVEEFNRQELKKSDCRYLTRYRQKFLYLDRADFGSVGKICRLRYTGQMDDWVFSIYKYSDSGYDAEEWMFTGSEHLDGTVVGAMKAGLEAYPPA